MEIKTQGITINEHPYIAQLRGIREEALKWLETATLPKYDLTHIRSLPKEEAESIQWFKPGDHLFEVRSWTGKPTYLCCTDVRAAGEPGAGMGEPPKQADYSMRGHVVGSDHTFSVGGGYIVNFLRGYVASRRDLDLWVEKMLANLREELESKRDSVAHDLQQLANFNVEINLPAH